MQDGRWRAAASVLIARQIDLAVEAPRLRGERRKPRRRVGPLGTAQDRERANAEHSAEILARVCAFAVKQGWPQNVIQQTLQNADEMTLLAFMGIVLTEAVIDEDSRLDCFLETKGTKPKTEDHVGVLLAVAAYMSERGCSSTNAARYAKDRNGQLIGKDRFRRAKNSEPLMWRLIEDLRPEADIKTLRELASSPPS